jgi:hypothetical protein
VINTFKKNIRKLLNRATIEKTSNGMTWYYEAHLIALDMSKRTNTELYKVVGIIAALSPQNKWERNIQDAESFLRYGMFTKVCTFNSNKVKAMKIFNAESEGEVINILNGMKTVSFYHNILNVIDYKVTIDRWALRVVKHDKSLTPKVYREIELAFQEVAKEVRLLPKQVQAITWEQLRSA